MKKFNNLLLFATALLFLPFLQSCNDDDDNSGNDPATMTYPHTIAFSHFENIDFKMWTNGAEVNTTGLNFIDFVEDDEDDSFLVAEYYESSPGLTFTEDSVFSMAPDSTIEGHPYIISNDSVYTQIDGFFGSDTIVNVFIGLGSPSHLRLVQGFSQYCDTYTGELTIISCSSNLHQKFHTLESALDEFGITALEDIEEGDTLIVNNRYVHFQ
ncbi:hypothetical protein G3O08_17530 [Cryomorpha ignava]|uniref:Uncharacterized protein n=1 Tax=Cryomorpha ignava TaxID=101383 RepID=A0A7K3WW78_9FLAO|nr:hypothetical protein [Cryomorpha ignava]NEN25301.1 hypothetical protein [Cryomorpha ignava]